MDASTKRLVDRAVEFHGHLCPGLMTGVRAAQIALRELGSRANDEELVAIVECDNCSVDAIQALTGCTFGKGNLLFRDYGKTAYTFIRRSDGRAVRVASRPRHHEEPEGYAELREEISAGAASAEEQERFQELHKRRALRLLDMPEEELFTVQPVQVPLPKEAQIHRSVLCEECGEPVMETRSRCLEGKSYCIPCFERFDNRW
ncbi:MAG: FmdE family protein [Anaerolineae bacterium]